MKIQDYVNKGLNGIVHQMGKIRNTEQSQYGCSIVFPNGYVASIINKEFYYSVAVCDYEGYFNWHILDKFNENEKSGAVICYTEDEVCNVLRFIEGLGGE